MQRSTIIMGFAILASIGVLISLGTWQVYRLQWKEDLIARVNARAAGPPFSLEKLSKLWTNNQDVDYLPVALKGRFDHDREMYYFNTWKGQSGWNVITPFYLDKKRIILLNRGFVPNKFRDKEKRPKGQIEGLVTIYGLARNPVADKPNSLVPENQLSDREFFWKSHRQMASIASNNTRTQILPFMVDAGANNFAARYPIGGTTRIQFSNNHLQYAGTWYGLALALLVVGTVFIYGRIKQSA